MSSIGSNESVEIERGMNETVEIVPREAMMVGGLELRREAMEARSHPSGMYATAASLIIRFLQLIFSILAMLIMVTTDDLTVPGFDYFTVVNSVSAIWSFCIVGLEFLEFKGVVKLHGWKMAHTLVFGDAALAVFTATAACAAASIISFLRSDVHDISDAHFRNFLWAVVMGFVSAFLQLPLFYFSFYPLT